jgi:hypothetical protein
MVDGVRLLLPAAAGRLQVAAGLRRLLILFIVAGYEFHMQLSWLRAYALTPPHAGHASHATCACVLSRSLEQTCEAAALLRSFFSSSPFVNSSLLQQSC